MKIRTIIAIGALGVVLAGCVETAPAKQSIGSLTGGLIGSKPPQAPPPPPAAGAAALYAAWGSSDLGRRLEEADRRMAAELEFEVLESETAGTTREWVNAATGHRGTVTPGPAYAVNQYTCRDYVDAVIIEGRQETRRSTACRQPDGSWRPIS